jgi:histidine triad (HIT) family protein
MDCIFCDIASGEAEAKVIFENENFKAFLDVNPVNYGHTLVVPKKHYDNFLTIPENELKELIKLTQFLAGVVKRSLSADGFNIISNNGSSAGQSVFHSHFHIIPRFDKDFQMKPQVKIYSGATMDEYADKIRSFVTKYEDLLHAKED